MPVNRVKWHTDFSGGIESGLFKMIAIGMGKLAGAERYHTHAYAWGWSSVVLAAARHVLALRQDHRRPGHPRRRPPQHRRLDAMPAEDMEAPRARRLWRW